MSGERPPSSAGADLIREFLKISPYGLHLGMELVDIETGRATVRLPYQEAITTMGDTVHGGALASLVDNAATAAAWAAVETPENLRGTTVSISIFYMSAARSEDTIAEAVVLRSGRSLSYIDVNVRGASGKVVAKAIVTYKLG
jgi:uncharacterized protein (TIGR00369 family)